MPKTRLYGKPDGDRIQGTLSKTGSVAFTKVRAYLVELHKAKSASDADVAEYLALDWVKARTAKRS